MVAQCLSPEALAAALGDLPHWRAAGGYLKREVRTSGWPATLLAANVIGYLAEAAWHHPDLTLSYGRLAVSLQTHDAGGVTGKDISLARQIEAVIACGRPQGAPAPGQVALLKPE